MSQNSRDDQQRHQNDKEQQQPVKIVRVLPPENLPDHEGDDTEIISHFLSSVPDGYSISDQTLVGFVQFDRNTTQQVVYSQGQNTRSSFSFDVGARCWYDSGSSLNRLRKGYEAVTSSRCELELF